MVKVKYEIDGKTVIATCSDINIYNEAHNLHVKVYDEQGELLDSEILSEREEDDILERLYEEKYEKEISF